MDDKQFYTSRNLERFPDGGKLNKCKKCITMHIDNWDPETFKWILEEIDVPYVKEWWDAILEKNVAEGRKISGITIIGKYLAKMKLKQWKDYRWEDGPRIEEELLQEKVTSMRAQGYSGEEIEKALSIDRTPRKPKNLIEPPQLPPEEDELGIPLPIVEDEESDLIGNNLTDEDKVMLKVKWGRGYTPDEWVRMEQLYNDMLDSYDIQTAGHKDTLIMICKASLKTNQLLDAGDIENAQKMARVYDSLMKSGKFTAAQNKVSEEDEVDSVGELVAMCERDGFIPRYYVDKPQDKVDRVLQDMQKYTHDLVTEELGLENLIQTSLKALEQERAKIQAAAENGDDFEEQQEAELFDYEANILDDQDFTDFQEAVDSLFDEEEEEE